jgi:hypothetical protein
MHIESTYRKVFPLLVLALLGVVACLQARGLTQLRELRSELARIRAAPPSLPPEPSSAPETPKLVPFVFTNPGPPPAVPETPMLAPVAERQPVLEVTPDNILHGLRSVRLVPEQRAGEVIGIRLFGIRPGNLLALFGIQNGDRLESINGFGLGTPARALEAYGHLRLAKRLDVHLVRAGAPLDLTLNIH